jgi:AraC family transcriptional regulator
VGTSSTSAPLTERLGAAVDYLEGHLGLDVRLEAAARRAGFSPWHFIRVFQAAAGVSPLEYVRRRRLSRAAAALAGGQAVIQVAYDWGYGSQAAFTRAFSRAFGEPPGTYRRRAQAGNPALDLTHPFEPRLPWPVEEPRPARIAVRPSSRWVGVATRANNRRFKAFADFPTFWRDWLDRERWRAVEGLVPGDRGHALQRLHPDGEVEYFIAVEVGPNARVPHGLHAMVMTGGHYVVFEGRGEPVRTAQSLVLGVYGHWLPRAGVRRRAGAWDMELFHLDPGAAVEQMRCELWVPIDARSVPALAG